jgi:hypothetical protein
VESRLSHSDVRIACIATIVFSSRARLSKDRLWMRNEVTIQHDTFGIECAQDQLILRCIMIVKKNIFSVQS